MAAPSVTYTFTNGTTADATEVNQNFSDIIDGITDGTEDLTIRQLICQGTATFNSTVNKVTITAPATSATVTIADGKTFTCSNTLSFSGTDASSVAFGTGGTVTYTSNTLAVFSATTSSQLAGVISDETGSGDLVFGTSPTIATPVFTGNCIFDTDTLVVDATNNRVGIGNASPAYLLQVGANYSGVSSPPSTNSELIVTDTSAACAISIVAADASGAFLDFRDTAANRFRINANSDDSIDFGQGSTATTRMSITTAGDLAVDTDTLFVDISTDRVGINTSSPEVELHVVNAGNTQMHIDSSGGTSSAGNATILLENDASVLVTMIKRRSGLGTDFQIINGSGGVYMNAGATAWTAISDMRVKNKISDFHDALNKIKYLNVFLYELKENVAAGISHIQLGLSAQEVQSVIPEITNTMTTEEDTYIGIEYDRLGPVIIKAIQEQQAIIESLKDRIEVLEGAS